jgi:hypothetical protein
MMVMETIAENEGRNSNAGATKEILASQPRDSMKRRVASKIQVRDDVKPSPSGAR